MYKYEVTREELDSIPIASREFIEECKLIGEKYKKKNDFFNFDALRYIAKEYKSMPKENDGISDCLTIGIDFMPDLKEGCLVVMRKSGNDIYFLNQFRGKEALELYYKLIGENNHE